MHAAAIRAGAKTAYAYAESSDGVTWDRRPLGLVTVNDQPTNLFRKSDRYEFGMLLVDEGAGYTPADQRYKFAWDEGGIEIAFSGDGKRFTPAATEGIANMGDIVDGFWDPLRKPIRTHQIFRNAIRA